MRKILIATHFQLANGFRSSLDYFLGTPDNVTYINCFIDDSDFREEIAKFFDANSDENDEIVAFTDILNGSINQELGSYLGRAHYHLITGVNLPTLLEVMMRHPDEYLEEDELCDIISNCQQSIIYFNAFAATATVMGEEDE
ncbi:MAG: hypothetical protein IJM15_02105 [Erysipelotrichaceae bacterium]|nr:hypothetical protein [Erysipelotrichaceae bacterium]